MNKSGAAWWEQNKLKLALAPALIFWLVSMACFVFGLSFKNPLGVRISGIDLSIIIAMALSLANTFVQVVGNDQDPNEMDTLFKFGWWGSYALGIGSNVNTLVGIIGISNGWVLYPICIGLGTMIEVLPEKLLVQFLQSVTIKEKKAQATKSSYNNVPQSIPRQEPKTERPIPQFQQKQNVPPFLDKKQYPQPRFEKQVDQREPTYHSVSYVEKGKRNDT